jgi:hypothetical protein
MGHAVSQTGLCFDTIEQNHADDFLTMLQPFASTGREELQFGDQATNGPRIQSLFGKRGVGNMVISA